MTVIRPAAMDFAVLDLAQDDDLLAWFYAHMQDREINWDSLFRTTRYQSAWTGGPILVDVRGHETLQASLRERMACEPVGFFISSHQSTLPMLASRLRAVLFANIAGKETLFRYYDPRGLSALFTVLEQPQADRLMTGSESWSWFADGQWQRLENTTAVHDTGRDNNTDNATEAPLVLTQQQIKQLSAARQSDVTEALHRHYRAHIPAQDTRAFVQHQIGIARECGFSRQRDYERWIRLAIKAGGPLETSARWIALQEEYPHPEDKLDRLEMEQG